jgi:hypothetical protein
MTSLSLQGLIDVCINKKPINPTKNRELEDKIQDLQDQFQHLKNYLELKDASEGNKAASKKESN